MMNMVLFGQSVHPAMVYICSVYLTIVLNRPCHSNPLDVRCDVPVLAE